jgi:threonylcarbamoyladenosine tRNA methylthiotransferase MtaB
VVTARAERDARRYVLRARRESPGVRVVAAGCLAERLVRFPGGPLQADLVVPLRDRSRLPGLVEALVGGAPTPPEGEGKGFFFQPTRRPAGRTRYFFKVQDGCDAVCAYCLVRVVRGGVSSLTAGRVLEHARALVEGGVREMVLCGTHLGAWGRDRGERLAGLVRSLDVLPGEWRWRLSSLEPWDLDDGLLEALSGASRFCRFFHIPLQSGSDRVLTAMGRPGSAAGLAALLERVRNRFPSARIGTDVMAGFPGETEADARATLDFVASSPLNYLHVFPFSPRPHRPDLRSDLAPAALTARADALKALDRGLREADRARRTGAPSAAVTAPWGGILEENLPCRFEEPPPPGRLVPVRIHGWEGATARVGIAV